MAIASRVKVDVALQYEVEQFLYEEAALLDERRFDEWLDLFTEDCHYWMPIRSTRATGDEEHEFTSPHENAYFDDTKSMLAQRIQQIKTGFHWAEDPPSRTRHMVTNVRVYPAEKPDEVLVKLDFLVYRTRLATSEDMWIGAREDTLRRVDGEWKIAKRHLFLEQAVLKSKNLSSFL
jgi:3-phenylpropionate/cinnamic acid dioxygenase small subunit